MTSPPPLTRAGFADSRSRVDAHDHAVCVYDAPEEMEGGFRAFLEEGLRAGALNLFVHSFDDDEGAWAFVERARPGSAKPRSDQLILVSLYTKAFQGAGPRIDHAHVAQIVEDLVSTADARGLSGVRIFVDASRRYFDEGREKEWFAFESWLGRRLQANVGLVCAYQRGHATRADLFPDVLRTHAYRFEGRRS